MKRKFFLNAIAATFVFGVSAALIAVMSLLASETGENVDFGGSVTLAAAFPEYGIVFVVLSAIILVTIAAGVIFGAAERRKAARATESNGSMTDGMNADESGAPHDDGENR